MIKPDQIPDEAVDALWWDGYDFGGELPAQKMRIMRAAIATALNAWPGMHKWDTGQVWHQASIILPLPTENTNAEG